MGQIDIRRPAACILRLELPGSVNEVDDWNHEDLMELEPHAIVRRGRRWDRSPCSHGSNLAGQLPIVIHMSSQGDAEVEQDACEKIPDAEMEQ